MGSVRRKVQKRSVIPPEAGNAATLPHRGTRGSECAFSRTGTFPRMDSGDANQPSHRSVQRPHFHARSRAKGGVTPLLKKPSQVGWHWQHALCVCRKHTELHRDDEKHIPPEKSISGRSV